tara:strand:- start:355 stop:633 length:279 start_codon:yes stop_codon:yes gene_type:complete
MKCKDINSFVDNIASGESIIVPEGLEEAFIGVDSESSPPRGVFSIEKCIAILSEDMAKKDAEDFFWFNIAGAQGEGVPLYINTPTEDVSPYQ